MSPDQWAGAVFLFVAAMVVVFEVGERRGYERGIRAVAIATLERIARAGRAADDRPWGPE